MIAREERREKSPGHLGIGVLGEHEQGGERWGERRWRGERTGDIVLADKNLFRATDDAEREAIKVLFVTLLWFARTI